MSSVPFTSIEHLPAAVVVRVLARELRKDEVDAICKDTDAARGTAPTLPFIIDLANVHFAGSLAMGVLVGLNQEFRGRNQRIIFVGLKAALGEVFAITRINRFLEILPDVAGAMESIGPGA